jgi:uncharacterized membrane protein SpoIIM required for sporulation
VSNGAAMPFCPRCRFGYRAGVRRCPDCGAALVARLPREPSHLPEAGPEAAAMQEAGALLVTVTGEIHARLLQDALRTQGILSRLQGVDNPLLPAWIPPPVTALQQRSFAVYVRTQDLSRARQVYADLESPVEQAEEDAEPDEEEGPEPPPFDLKAYLRRLYGREIPRLLKDLRWYLLAVVVLDGVGTVVGYRLGMASDPTAHFPGASLPVWLHPFLRWADSAPAWLGVFLHNALVAVYYYLWGILSAGLLTLYEVWLQAQFSGWVVATWAPDAHAAAGSGVGGTAAGLLLPHGVLEAPAFWVIKALGLRAGLVWIRPLAGMRRRQSAAAVFGQFRSALLAVIPVLFLAAILETQANPWFHNRYLVGLGRAPGMVSEQRVGRARLSSQPAWSPDGTSFASVSRTGHSVWTRKRGDDLFLLTEDESKHFTAPAWAPDGVQIALLSASPGAARSALLTGRASEKGLDEVTEGPPGRYLQAAWHPADGRIGVLVEGEHAPGKPSPRNLWAADPALHVWEQLTHLPDGAMSRYGFSWSPGGRQIVFARQLAPKSHSTQLWVIDSDGGHPRRLTTGTRDAWPAWSPDGKWIAFLSLPPVPEEEGEEPDALERDYPPLSHICLIRADGTDRRDNVAGAEGCQSLSWLENGRKLFYLRLGTMIAGTPKGL